MKQVKGEKRFRALVGKLEEQRQLERCRRRWEDNNKSSRNGVGNSGLY
jgi:hypothetical protein